MSKCLVVNTEILRGLPFWSRMRKIEGKISAALPLLKEEIAQLIETIENNKVFKERFGENGVENDPTWQQIGLYGILLQERGMVFVYQRANDNNYSDKDYVPSCLSELVGIWSPAMEP